jgi:type VI protein secretion system component Hcp
LPVDSVSLNFAQLVIEYTPTNADGVNGQTISAGWNVRTHKKV